MLCRHVFGKIFSEFRGISRVFVNFAGFRGFTWNSRLRDRAKYQKPWTNWSYRFLSMFFSWELSINQFARKEKRQMDRKFLVTMHTNCHFQLISVVKIKKNVAVDKKSFIFCTRFGAQNAGNGISELPDFKIFWGSMLPDPSRLRGLYVICRLWGPYDEKLWPRAAFSRPRSRFCTIRTNLSWQITCLVLQPITNGFVYATLSLNRLACRLLTICKKIFAMSE